jgi:hypothetical protein
MNGHLDEIRANRRSEMECESSAPMASHYSGMRITQPSERGNWRHDLLKWERANDRQQRFELQ